MKQVLNNRLVPFLKWAGGKRWLAQYQKDLFPKAYRTYLEPFLGSGAVFFSLMPDKAILADLNSELIETYSAIREKPELVERYLRFHARRHSKQYYYLVRSTTYRSSYQRAAKFIYLNRTCWNGLYRVNLKGVFNVPIGTKTKVLMDTDDFATISGLLQKAELCHADFRQTIEKAQKGDFLFIDPPYTVRHNFNGFVKYNDRLFSWEDQVALSEACFSASNKGVKIFMTNANHGSIRELYEGGFSLTAAERSSVLAGSSSHRCKTSELFIANY